MRLSEIYVLGFGCLRDVRIRLGERLNLILAPNDEGKTTLQHFIPAILYPFTATALRRRFKPWRGEDYGGSLAYQLANGRKFLVKKVIKDTPRKDMVRLFEELSGEDVTSRYRTSTKGPLFAEEQLNMTKESFEGIPVVRQLQVAEIGDDKVRKEVMEKIKSLVATGQERMGLEDAIGKLERRLEEIGKTETRGRETEAARAYNRVNDLREEFKELSKAHKDLETVLEKIGTLKRKLQDCSRRERELDYKVRAARALDLRYKWKEAQAVREAYERKYGEKIPEKELVGFLENKRRALIKYKMISPQDLEKLRGLLERVKNNDTRVDLLLKDVERQDNDLKALKTQIEAIPALYSALTLQEVRDLRKIEAAVTGFDISLDRSRKDYERNLRRLQRARYNLRPARLFFGVGLFLFLVSLISFILFRPGLISQLRLPLEVAVAGLVLGAVAAVVSWSVARRIKGNMGAIGEEMKDVTLGLLSQGRELVDGIRGMKPIFEMMSGLEEPETGRLAEDLGFEEVIDITQAYMNYYRNSKAQLFEAGACGDYDEMEDQLTRFQRLIADRDRFLKDIGERRSEAERLERENERLLEDIRKDLEGPFPEVREGLSVDQVEEFIEEIGRGQRDHDELGKDIKNVRNLLEGKEEEFLKEVEQSRLQLEEMLRREPRLREIEVERTRFSAYQEEHERIKRQINDLDKMLTSKETERDEKLKGKRVLADVEMDLEDAERRLDRIKAYREAIIKAKELLRKAGERVYRDVAPNLNSFLTTKVSELSGGRYCETLTDEDLNLKVKIRELGTWESSEVLGGGMRAGLYLLLRVGILQLIAEKGGEVPPLIMDEAFNSFDDFGESRLDRIVNILCDIIEENPSFQLIYFTCQEKGQYLPIKGIIQSRFGNVVEERVGNLRIARDA